MHRASAIVLCTLGVFMMYAAMAEKNPSTVPESRKGLQPHADKRVVIATKMLFDGRAV